MCVNAYVYSKDAHSTHIDIQIQMYGRQICCLFLSDVKAIYITVWLWSHAPEIIHAILFRVHYISFIRFYFFSCIHFCSYENIVNGSIKHVIFFLSHFRHTVRIHKLLTQRVLLQVKHCNYLFTAKRNKEWMKGKKIEENKKR